MKGIIMDDGQVLGLDRRKYQLPTRGTCDDGYPEVLLDTKVINGKGSFYRQSIKPFIGMEVEFSIVPGNNVGYNFKVIKPNTDNKTIYHLFTDKKRNEYDVHVTELNKDVRKIELVATEDECWTSHTRGKVLAKLIDHGNGQKVIIPEMKDGNLDYDEVEYLRIILSIDNKYYSGFKPVEFMVVEAGKEEVIV